MAGGHPITEIGRQEPRGVAVAFSRHDGLLANYNRNCAVTGPKFVYSATVEAEAAHIIAKGNKGTDYPPQRARAVKIRPLGLRPWPTKRDPRSKSGFREWVDEDDRPRMQAERSAGRNADQAPDNPACCRSFSYHNGLHKTQKQRAAHSPNVPRLSATGLPA